MSIPDNLRIALTILTLAVTPIGALVVGGTAVAVNQWTSEPGAPFGTVLVDQGWPGTETALRLADEAPVLPDREARADRPREREVARSPAARERPPERVVARPGRAERPDRAEKPRGDRKGGGRGGKNRKG